MVAVHPERVDIGNSDQEQIIRPLSPGEIAHGVVKMKMQFVPLRVQCGCRRQQHRIRKTDIHRFHIRHAPERIQKPGVQTADDRHFLRSAALLQNGKQHVQFLTFRCGVFLSPEFSVVENTESAEFIAAGRRVQGDARERFQTLFRKQQRLLKKQNPAPEKHQKQRNPFSPGNRKRGQRTAQIAEQKQRGGKKRCFQNRHHRCMKSGEKQEHSSSRADPAEDSENMRAVLLQMFCPAEKGPVENPERHARGDRRNQVDPEQQLPRGLPDEVFPQIKGKQDRGPQKKNQNENRHRRRGKKIKRFKAVLPSVRQHRKKGDERRNQKNRRRNGRKNKLLPSGRRHDALKQGGPDQMRESSQKKRFQKQR